MADEQPIMTAVAEPPTTRGWRQVHPVLIVAIAVALAVLVGWIIAGLPGVGASHTLSLVLILVSIASGGLTLAFVIRAVRRARRHTRATRGEGIAVLVSSAITGIISIAQMIQVLQQILH